MSYRPPPKDRDSFITEGRDSFITEGREVSQAIGIAGKSDNSAKYGLLLDFLPVAAVFTGIFENLSLSVAVCLYLSYAQDHCKFARNCPQNFTSGQRKQAADGPYPRQKPENCRRGCTCGGDKASLEASRSDHIPDATDARAHPDSSQVAEDAAKSRSRDKLSRTEKREKMRCYEQRRLHHGGNDGKHMGERKPNACTKSP